MSILFGGGIPSYEEQLELCRRINEARHHKPKQQLPAAKPQSVTEQHAELCEIAERINAERRAVRRQARRNDNSIRRRPYLAWVNPRPPRIRA
jgi:hypothetical protein